MYGLAVTFYLFLGATGAGAGVILSFLGWRACANASARVSLAGWRRLLSAGYASVFFALLLGVLCLLCDLEHPERIVALLTSPAPAYLTVGAYALAACLAASGTCALAWSSRLHVFGRWLRVGGMRVLSVTCGALSLVVAAYTGLLLAGVRAVPLWNSWLLPVLFVASALSCGAALVMLVAHLRGEAGLLALLTRWMLRVDVAAVLCEAASAFALLALLSLQAGSQPAPGLVPPALGLAAARSLQMLLSGDAAWLFWGGFVGCGLAVPLASGSVSAVRRAPLGARAATAVATGVLLGGLALRACVIGAGVSLVDVG